MGAAHDILRGALTLGYFFGGVPAASLAIGRTRTREEARAVALAHLRRTRRLGGITFSVAGEDLVPARGGFVVVYNETSLADLFVTTEVLWRHTDRNVIAGEFGRIPLMTRAAERTGLVLMPRGNRDATSQILDMLANSAAAGERVTLAAQGGVALAPGVEHFKRGAFLIAIRARVPVVPMAVRGGREILPPRALRIRPGRIACRFGAPIPSAGVNEDDAPRLAEAARVTVSGMYDAMTVS